MKKRKPNKPITTEKAMNNFLKELRKVKKNKTKIEIQNNEVTKEIEK